MRSSLWHSFFALLVKRFSIWPGIRSGMMWLGGDHWKVPSRSYNPLRMRRRAEIIRTADNGSAWSPEGPWDCSRCQACHKLHGKRDHATVTKAEIRDFAQKHGFIESIVIPEDVKILSFWALTGGQGLIPCPLLLNIVTILLGNTEDQTGFRGYYCWRLMANK